MKSGKSSPTLAPVFAFLKQIKKNNNRDWFAAHKADYSYCHGIMIAFADELLNEMNKKDKIETPSGQKSLFRIYRDTRFSANKTPYKCNWAGGFSRATHLLRGSYYYHIEPGNSYISGGFYGPNAEDLLRIRKEIEFNYPEFRKILKKKAAFFSPLVGDQLKTAPRGFDPAHPAIDLLRYKQFYLRHYFTDKEVLSADFVKKTAHAFQQLRPFLDYMSEVLTTDENGSPLS